MASSIEQDEDPIQKMDYESMDPTQWKDQDHYLVLGLGHLRYKATKEDIRKTYRQLILKYHPDKQAATGEVPNIENVFACIKTAYDILVDPKRRQAYDSVDPEFSDEIPSINAQSKENFFEVFGPVFERNSRWSTKQPVPQLGDESSTYEEVDQFYSFWYAFDSWREYSYLDKEDSKKGEDREERRWLEKQNKAERLMRKKEENARIRMLVDNAYNCDMRVKKFKEEEKLLKESLKKAKEEASRRQEEERELERQQALEQERLAKLREEDKARAEAEALKKEKELKKKELRSKRKALRNLCKDMNYFVGEGKDTVQQVSDLELLCEVLTADQLEELTQQLKTVSIDETSEVFRAAVAKEKNRLELEAREKLLKQDTAKTKVGGGSGQEGSGWSNEEMEVLVKAVNVYPPGTIKRWDTIAEYINYHVPTANKTAKQVIKVVKNLQQSDQTLKEAEEKQFFSRFEQDHLNKLQSTAGITERIDGSGVTITRVERPWTQEEQRLLEQGLTTHPSSDRERWDKISNLIPTRTKRECLVRFKELIDRVRHKMENAQ